jgi:hypothetical protein
LERLLFLGNLLPTGPLAITSTKVLQTDVVAADTVQNLFVPFHMPVQKEMAFTHAFGTFHLALDPF